MAIPVPVSGPSSRAVVDTTERFGFRDLGSEIRVQRFGLRDLGLEIWVQRFGFKDLGNTVGVMHYSSRAPVFSSDKGFGTPKKTIIKSAL